MILQSLNFSILMRYLTKNSQCSTPWLVHPYVNKEPWKWLRRLLLMFFADRKWFYPPWGCYLTNPATLVFITFDIYKDPTLVDCNIWNFLGLSSSNLQEFKYTALRQFLLKKSLYFTSWLSDLNVNKGHLQWFSRFL